VGKSFLFQNPSECVVDDVDVEGDREREEEITWEPLEKTWRRHRIEPTAALPADQALLSTITVLPA